MKQKGAAFFAAVYLLLSSAVTVFAISSFREPVDSGSPWSRYTVDRIDLEIDKTSFTFEEAGDDSPLRLSFHLRLKKSEADLFASIDSLSITGCDAKTEFLCETPGTVLNEDGSFTLPVENGEAVAVVFQVNVTLPAPTGSETPTLAVRFRSGLSPESAAPRLLEIPLTLRTE